MVQWVKNPSAMWESWLRSLVWEDPLEKGMAACSGILAWRIPWTGESSGLQSMGLQTAGPNLVTKQQQSTERVPEPKVDVN